MTELSTNIKLSDIGNKKADVIFSETIGTSILGEGQLNWIVDSRKRLGSNDVKISPGSARQYLIFMESPIFDSRSRVDKFDEFDLTPINCARFTSHFFSSKEYGISFDKFNFKEMNKPVCIIDIDFYNTELPLPKQRVFKVPILNNGTGISGFLF